MAHRLRVAYIVAISLLTSVALAQGQSMSFSGLGPAGGLDPGSYHSLGTVPALLGQSGNTVLESSMGRLRADSFGQHPYNRYPSYGYYASDMEFGLPSYFAAYFGGGYANAYGQDGGQQQGNGSQTQSQGGNQNQGMSANQNQTKKGEGKEEAPPEKPQYLTYTPKKKTLQEEAKSGKALVVDFKSIPAGAVVTVDGYFLGKTPMTERIPLGKHLVSITKWGYESWEHELDVRKGKSLNVNPTLHKDW